MTGKSYKISSDLSETSLLRSNRSVFDGLLIDRTTGKNIRWGTDNYLSSGFDFSEDKEIKINLITGWYDGLIQPRADKNNEVQLERTRNRAEVFTPSWIVEKQVNAVMDEMYALPLQQFLSTKWIEITCGEAPYMANRYDMLNGKLIPLKNRAGFVDVKFKRLNAEVDKHDQWVTLALCIYKSSYGYEYQGDSLLLARENLLLTFIDNYFFMFGAVPTDDLLLKVTDIISKNVFQMDGLTYYVPYSEGGCETVQLSLFDEIDEEKTKPSLATIELWDLGMTVQFINIIEGGNPDMKFDVVIGNPPYQDEAIGASTHKPPIFHTFMDESYKIGKKVLLITPARFLFNAGSTPRAWNEKMLNDEYLKVLYYEPKSQKIFLNTDIKGGIAITYRDSEVKYLPIKVFTAFNELNHILEKVMVKSEASFSELFYSSESYKLTDKLHNDYPLAESRLSRGHKFDLKTNIFDSLDEVFTKDTYGNSNDYVRVYGRQGNRRVLHWVLRDYINGPDNFDKYKVLLPQSNGSGALGEVLSTPLIGQPLIGHTQTFLSIGKFEYESEAEACLRYVKSKFSRVLLGVLKVTQHNPARTWKHVPLQNFTANSDIDWTKPIPEIDQQLYKKYKLTQTEIDFIEEKVKEMV